MNVTFHNGKCYLLSCVLQNWSQRVGRKTLLCALFLWETRKTTSPKYTKSMQAVKFRKVTQLKMNNSIVSRTTKVHKDWWWWHTNLGGSEPGPGVVVGVGVDRLGLAISSPGICKEDNYLKVTAMIDKLEWYDNTSHVDISKWTLTWQVSFHLAL